VRLREAFRAMARLASSTAADWVEMPSNPKGSDDKPVKEIPGIYALLRPALMAIALSEKAVMVHPVA